MGSVTVIAADLADPAHAAGVVACIESYASDPMGGSSPLPAETKATMVEGLRATPATRVWLAHDTDAGAFIGVVVAFAGFSTFAAKPRWNVHDVAVVPEARNRGVGRALLTRVIEDAADEATFNRVLWHTIKGPGVPYPAANARRPSGQAIALAAAAR